MHINQLPSDCLLHVFARCSLREQLTLRSTCHRWWTLVHQLGRTRRSLKLFASAESIREYCHSLVEYNLHEHPLLRLRPSSDDNNDDLMRVRSLNLDMFVTLFPNVRHLVICFTGGFSEIANLTSLTRWTKLRSVTLFGMPTSVVEQHQVWQWLAHRSPHLEQCHLLHMFNCTAPSDFTRFDFAQLTHLSVGRFPNNSGGLHALLERLGPRLSTLSLDNCCLSLAQLTDLAQWTLWPASLARLRLNFVKFDHRDYPSVLQLICSHFPRLASLDFSFSLSFDLVDLMPFLAELKHLTELRLHLSPNSNSGWLSSVVQPNVSVRHLELVLYAYDAMASTASSGRHALPQVFPHLERLRLVKHHATPWPVLPQLCHLRALPLLTHCAECTLESIKDDVFAQAQQQRQATTNTNTAAVASRQ